MSIVARCTLPDRSDLACSIVTLGAAEWWPMYVRRYGLRPCPLPTDPSQE